MYLSAYYCANHSGTTICTARFFTLYVPRLFKICYSSSVLSRVTLRLLNNTAPPTPLCPRGGYQTLFPGRLEIILGDSKETIPVYTQRERHAGRDPRTCNIAFVDGDHSEEGAYADLVSFEALANR